MKGLNYFDPPGHDSPSFETPADHPLVQTACALRNQAEAEIVPYGCDASKLAGAGIPSIVFGPEYCAGPYQGRIYSPRDLEAGTTAYWRSPKSC